MELRADLRLHTSLLKVLAAVGECPTMRFLRGQGQCVCCLLVSMLECRAWLAWCVICMSAVVVQDVDPRFSASLLAMFRPVLLPVV